MGVIPLPPQITQYFPEHVVGIMQWFAFCSFAGLLTIPWLFCVYQLVTHNVGRTRKIKTVLDEYSAPKVVIVMPCYNEEPEILLRTVDSIVDCEYPPSCLHVFLSFDGDEEKFMRGNSEASPMNVAVERFKVQLCSGDFIRSPCVEGGQHMRRESIEVLLQVYLLLDPGMIVWYA